MSEVKRYGKHFNEYVGMDIVARPDGAYVKHEDYEAIKAERDKLLAQCAELRAIQEWKALVVEDAIAQSFREGVPVNRMRLIESMTEFAARLRAGEEK